MTRTMRAIASEMEAIALIVVVSSVIQCKNPLSETVQSTFSCYYTSVIDFASRHSLFRGDTMKKAMGWLLLILLLWKSGAAREAAGQAVILAATVVFPSLFPFAVLTRRCTGLHGAYMGLIGGYPLGIAGVCTMVEQGRVSESAGKRLLRFCNLTGPGFYFGMVGGMLGYPMPLCLAQFGIHALSGLLLFPMPLPKPFQREVTSESLAQSIAHCAKTVAGLCGYVVFYSTLLNVILQMRGVTFLMEKLPIPLWVTRSLVSGLVDLPSGVNALSQGESGLVQFVLCAMLTAFGGICVGQQAKSLWQAQGIELPEYYGCKLLHALLAGALAIPVGGLLLHTPVSLLWYFLPVVFVFLKIGMDFFLGKGYNVGKMGKGSRRHAVS